MLSTLLATNACNSAQITMRPDLQVQGGNIYLSLDPRLESRREEITAWVRDGAETVATFFGKFPIPNLDVQVRLREGRMIGLGTAYDGRRIEIDVSSKAGTQQFRRDWTMTHEMFHLGFPALGRDSHYLEEGFAVYFEPLSRARQGKLRANKVWRDFLEGMPQAFQGDVEGGFNGTTEWGPTYWGGCLFWLLVDLDIRERTKNEKSLDDAIHAIFAAGGTGDQFWAMDRLISVADRATGTGSVERIHAQLGSSMARPDLGELWKKLGVHQEGNSIVFDDQAPMASIRRALIEKH